LIHALLRELVHFLRYVIKVISRRSFSVPFSERTINKRRRSWVGFSNAELKQANEANKVRFNSEMEQHAQSQLGKLKSSSCFPDSLSSQIVFQNLSFSSPLQTKHAIKQEAEIQKSKAEFYSKAEQWRYMPPGQFALVARPCTFISTLFLSTASSPLHFRIWCR
jgi:hypothetical protein